MSIKRALIGLILTTLAATPMAADDPDTAIDLHTNPQLQKAQRHMRDQQWSDAIAILSELNRQHPQVPAIVNELALAQFYSGDQQQAADTLEKLLLQDPNLADSYKNLQTIYSYMAAQAYARATNFERPIDTPELASYAPARSPQSEPVTEPISQQPEPVTPELPQLDPAQIRAELEQRLRRFATTWAQGDIEQYLAFYAADRSPTPNLSRQKWEQQRRNRVTPNRKIEVEVSNIAVAVEPDGERAVVNFHQLYRSKTYRDKVSKRMLWIKQGDEWRIAREVTIEVL